MIQPHSLKLTDTPHTRARARARTHTHTHTHTHARAASFLSSLPSSLLLFFPPLPLLPPSLLLPSLPPFLPPSPSLFPSLSRSNSLAHTTSRSVDLVTVSFGLGSLDAADVKQTLLQIRRVLKPQGIE